MKTNICSRPFALCIVTMLPLACAVSLVHADQYRITPGGSDTALLQGIEAQLQKANCGYPKPATEKDTLTTVTGLPLKPNQWMPQTWAQLGGKNPEPDQTKLYPDTAQGLVFATYDINPNCKAFHQQKQPQVNGVTCNTSADCRNVCNQVNQYDAANRKWQYPVFRYSTCSQWQNNDQGNPVWVTVLSKDQLPNTCGGLDPNLKLYCLPGWQPGDLVQVGMKYECTGNWGEEQAGVLQVNYGWVWKADGSAPDVNNLPATCLGTWTGGEPIEHRNCRKDGCTGAQCRTDPDDPNNPPQPANHPQPAPFDPLNGSRYESFFRLYTATHTLSDKIPDVQAQENDIQVHLACYDWYKEQNDPNKPVTIPDDLNCVADDLQLEKLQQRKIDDNGTINTALKNAWDGDTVATPVIVGDGGTDDAFGFDPKKQTSHIETPPLMNDPALIVNDRSFGETKKEYAKYIDALQMLSLNLDGQPPTVSLILPLLTTSSELAPLLAAGNQTPDPGRSLLDVSVPLEPGLIEEVQAVLHESLLSHMQEQAVPVVVPLLSQSQIQQSLQRWTKWRGERQLMGLDTGDADTLIGKLKDYGKKIEQYGQMRSELPKAISAVLDRRKKLEDKIDQWISDRMGPYAAAVGNAAAEQAFADAWKALKTAANTLTVTNTPYCKNDYTTPVLPWMEMPDDFLPQPLKDLLDQWKQKMPTEHFNFDFSDVFLEGDAAAIALKVPVLDPIQVAIAIPAPDESKVGDANAAVPVLPDLPEVPSLPPLPPDNLTVTDPPPSTVPPPDILPFQQIADAVNAEAAQLKKVTERYTKLLWVKEKHPNLDCPGFGKNGCVFPETKLWDVFMRIWAPVGAFLTPDPNLPVPLGQGVPVHCDAQCQLRQYVDKEGLRVTLPPVKADQNSSIDATRKQLREQTIDANGNVKQDGNGKAPLYQITSPLQLYDAYPVPVNVPLDFQSSSAPAQP